MKIGLIAGGGDLPRNVIAGARAQGHDVYLAAIDGFAAAETFDVPGDTFGIGEFGRMSKAFKKTGCSHVCMAGNVARPDFSKVKPDLKGMMKLPGAIKAARTGDDSLLAYLLEVFENEGFIILSPQTICANLVMPDGHLGRCHMGPEHREDIIKACRIAAEVGALDIGQGAIVCDGLVLAVEAQEGTDAMLIRTAELPSNLRGSPLNRKGVLAKMLKPGQESRVDLPTIGPETIENAARAGLAGIVAEAGQAFIIDKDVVIDKADAAGLFVMGLPSQGV